MSTNTLNKIPNNSETDKLTTLLNRVFTSDGTIYAISNNGHNSKPVTFSTSQINPKREKTVPVADRLLNIDSGYLSLARHQYQQNGRYTKNSIISQNCYITKTRSNAENAEELMCELPLLSKIPPSLIIEDGGGLFYLVWCFGWNVQRYRLSIMGEYLTAMLGTEAMEEMPLIPIPGTRNLWTGKKSLIIYNSEYNYDFDGFTNRLIFEAPEDLHRQIVQKHGGYNILRTINHSTRTFIRATEQIEQIRAWREKQKNTETDREYSRWFYLKKDLCTLLSVYDYNLGKNTNNYLFAAGCVERMMTKNPQDVETYLLGLRNLLNTDITENEVRGIAQRIIRGPENVQGGRYCLSLNWFWEHLPMYALNKPSFIYDPKKREAVEAAKKRAAAEKRAMLKIKKQREFEKRFVKEAAQARYTAELARNMNISRPTAYKYIKKLSVLINNKIKALNSHIKNYICRFISEELTLTEINDANYIVFT